MIAAAAAAEEEEGGLHPFVPKIAAARVGSEKFK
jgi:hypothetical protein